MGGSEGLVITEFGFENLKPEKFAQNRKIEFSVNQKIEFAY